MADVLIVDDDLDAAGALSDVMEAEGHDPRVAYNGREGLAQLELKKPDLVLLDVDMPVLNGPGMANAMFIHDLGFECIPVVLVSGVPNLSVIAAQIGTPYRLAKPFRYEQIASLVERALRERRTPRPAA